MGSGKREGDRKLRYFKEGREIEMWFGFVSFT